MQRTRSSGTGARGRERGFTLIELMIVISVLAILAALSIPRLLEAKSSSYETSAHTYLRHLNQVEATFRARENRFAPLDELRAKAYLTAEEPPSYAFALTVTANASDYEATAVPRFQQNVMRYFFIDSSGVVRYEVGSPADDQSPPL